MNKLLKALILTTVLIFIAGTVYATQFSTKLSEDGLTLTIYNIDEGDALDWVWTDSFTDAKYADGIRVNYIRFHPGATNDLCSIEDADNSEVKHFLALCADVYDDKVQYYHGSKLKLEIDCNDTDGTWAAVYSAGNVITIQLWRTQEP